MRVDRCDGRARYRCGARVGRVAGPLFRTRRRQLGQFSMSARQLDPQISPAHPRETTALFGHRDAEMALLSAYRGGRLPHAWLIGGPPGIGKATLAYRMARFVLAHPDPRAPAVQTASSLDVDPNHPVARRIAAQAHGDLLVLERTINEKTGKLYQDIQVDQVRRSITFFGSTAGAG